MSANSGTHAIAFDDVSKVYGTVRALDRVSFSAEMGEVIILLGPNGAGKTTASMLLAGLLRPSNGTVRVCGGDPRVPRTRKHIGVATQFSFMPPTITVAEVVAFSRAHYPDPLPMKTLLDEFGLSGVAAQQIRQLSGGFWRRTCLCAAFAGQPDIVILDEPTGPLDVEARRAMSRWVAEYAHAGHTVFMTTHHLNEAQDIADRVIVLQVGRVIFDGSVQELRARVATTRVSICRQDLPPLPADVRVEVLNGRTDLYTADIGGLVEGLVRDGARLDRLEVMPGTLEDAFLALTSEL